MGIMSDIDIIAQTASRAAEDAGDLREQVALLTIQLEQTQVALDTLLLLLSRAQNPDTESVSVSRDPSKSSSHAHRQRPVLTEDAYRTLRDIYRTVRR